jgi:general secretion pathway protein G
MILRQKQEIQKVVRQGFTLMEVLVVVAIILILASLGGYYLLGQVDEARKSAAKAQVRTITQACETYKLHNFQYPGTLDILLQPDPNGGPPLLKNAEALTDPWGRPYQYDASGANNRGTQPDIWSGGPSGNEKLGNWGKIRN